MSVERILSTNRAVANAVGLSRWAIEAIKAASRGQPDCPWSGRYTTARKVNRWLFRHPEFVASKVHRCSPLSHCSTCPNTKESETNPSPNPKVCSVPKRIRIRTRTRKNPNPISDENGVAVGSSPAATPVVHSLSTSEPARVIGSPALAPSLPRPQGRAFDQC